MRVPTEWLRDFIDSGLGPEELAHKLTMAGLEVEAMERPEEGISLSTKATCEMPYIFEVNITPNRADCLSILGIAREVSAITGKPVKMPEHAIADEHGFPFGVEINDEDLCRRYAGRAIRGVNISESPGWLKHRLAACGVRPINNIVDITNYVMFEFGQPLHAFDLDRLKEKIVVKRAGKDASITTLDGVERKLPEESLLIWDSERPVAVAGVMGGKDTEVTGATKNIFLESAWFAPYSVRRTSKALGLGSESSYRFERGVDIENVGTALDRAARLMAEVAGGSVGKKIDVYPKKYVPVEIIVPAQKVNRLLGTDIPASEMLGILRRLGFDAIQDGDALRAMTASFRPDISIGADIVEEIARIYGYGRIPTSMPVAPVASEGIPQGMPRKLKTISRIKSALRLSGYTEAINMSFMNPQHLDLLGIGGGDKRRKAIAVKNPLRQEDSHLRTTLVPSMVENFRHNFFRGIKDIRLFELSRVFTDIGEALPKEELMLAGVRYAEKAPSLWKDYADDFYLLKGAIEALLQELNIAGVEFRPSDEPFLHPGKASDVYLDGEKSGFLGALSPTLYEKLDIKPRAGIVVFELDADAVISKTPERLSYVPVPKYPHIERDIAIIVNEGVKAGDVIALIKSYPSEFIEEAFVFDSYKGANIPEGKKSLAFGLRYRSKDRTLVDEEVEKIHSGLIGHLVQKTGGEIRK